MRHLRCPKTHAEHTSPNATITAVLVSISMIAPLFIAMIAVGPEDARGEIGTGDLLYWPQFQKTEQRSGIYTEPLRGIEDPVIKWDLGLNVQSMGTTAADFRKNGLEEDGYDRDIVHLLFCAENEDGNTTIYIVDGETGESAWELDMGSKTIEAGPVVGYVNNNVKLDIVFASSDGMVYAYQPTIGYDPEQGEGDRYIWDDFNIEVDKLWIYETDLEILDVSPLLTDLTPTTGDDSLDVVISVRQPDKETHCRVFAFEGNTNDDSGSKIWERELEGGLPSSPTTLVEGENAYLWIACYDDENEEEYLYSLKGKDGSIWKTVSEHATRGYWDMFIPSPVIADIDGDGKQDIVFAVPLDPTNSEDYGTVYVYNLFGEPLNEWKYGVPIKGRIGATPVVGDLKGDGREYIVVQAWYFSGTTDASTVVTALKRDGSKLWSKEFNTDSDTLEDRAVSSPVLFDLDGNGKMDVISATNPRVYAFNGTYGSFMPGFSPGRRLDDEVHQLYDTPAIGDFNKDGIFDIAIDSAVITHEIAELEAGDLRFSDQYPEAGEEITIIADVYNNGTSDTGNVLIRFLDENTTIKEETYTIHAGQTADPIPRVMDYEVSEGWHTFTVIVDPDNEIEEVNKSNNVRSETIFVAAPYDFTMSAPDKEGFAYPQTTIGFPVKIENIGTKEDTYAFVGTGLPNGWNFDVSGPLDENEELTLVSRETGNISVDITVPDTDAGTSASLKFNVSSTSIEKTIQVEFRVEVLQEHDARFEIIGTNDKSVTPGGQVEFELRVSNTGNGLDNYTLTREDPPVDWEANFNIININKVAAGRPRTAYITLIAPEINELGQDNEIADLTLTVSSRDNDTVEETVRVRAEISQLAVVDDYLSQYPGENATYTIEIFNKENRDDTVALDEEFGYNGWDYSFAEPSIFVPALSKVVTTLNVLVPTDADPLSVNELPFEAVFENQSVIEDQIVWTEARQRHRVAIISFENASGGDAEHSVFTPGETQDYSLTFENQGNWFDTFEVTSELPAGWTAEFDPTGATDMERATTQVISMSVTASPVEWAFMNHTLTFHVSSTENESDEARDSVTLNITMERVRSIDIHLNSTEYFLEPSQELIIPVIITNTGNWYENISLDLELPGNVNNYSISLDGTEYPYLPFGSRQFNLTIHSPDALDPQVVAGLVLPITLTAESDDLGLSEDGEFYVIIRQVFGSEITGDLTGTIKPGEVMNIALTIRNMGNGHDTFSMSNLNLDSEWETVLVNRSGGIDTFLIALAPGDTWDFTFRITAPGALSEQAKAGYRSQSAVGAESRNGETGYALIELDVEQVYLSSIEVTEKERRIVPGAVVNYTLTIKNIGNGDDSITISTTEPPNFWDIRIQGGRNFDLGYGEQATRVLAVTAPDKDSEPEFGETASIEVRAETLGAGGFGSVTINTTISYVMPQEIEHFITPGSTKDIPFIVMDVSGVGSKVVMQTDTNDPWKVNFKDGGISRSESLTAYERRTIYLTVTSPSLEQTIAGDKHPVWINISSPEEDNFITVMMIVKAVYDFNVTAVSDIVEGDQGTTMTFTYDLTNIGNIVDIYTCFVTLADDDWIGTFTGLQEFQDGEDTLYYTSLGQRDTTQFHLEVTLPEYVESKEYEITMTVRSDHGKSISLKTIASINPVYGLGIEADVEVFTVRDGDDITIDMDVNNIGNSRDNVTMSVSGLPFGWNSIFSPVEFSFQAQTTKTVRLTLTIPIGYPTSDVDLTLGARSEGSKDSAFDDVVIKVSLQEKPDLTVEGITFSPASPKEGDTVTITAEIGNLGNAVAQNVVVQFYANGRILGEDSISSINPSTKTEVTFDWEPNEGTYAIRVIADPAQDIEEKNDDNNDRTDGVQVAAPDDTSNIVMLVAILIIGSLAMGLFIVKPWEQKNDEEDDTTSTGQNVQGGLAPPPEMKQPTARQEIDYSEDDRHLIGEKEDAFGTDGEDGGVDPAMTPITREKPKARISFDEEIFPVILNCPSCKKKIRIVKEGKFRCPGCAHIGRVDETGELVRGDGPKIAQSNWDDADESPRKDGARTENDWNDDDNDDSARSTGSTRSRAAGVTPVTKRKDSLFPMRYVCEDCGKKSTVEKAGWHKCPFCGEIHTIDKEGEIDSDDGNDRTTSRSGGSQSRVREETTDDPFPRTTSTSSRSRADDWLDEDSPTSDTQDDSDAQMPASVASFPAVVACPSCAAKMRVQQKGTYRCPSCSETFPVGKPSQITSNCPWCDVKIQVKRKGDYNCPSCEKRLTLDIDGSATAQLQKATKKEWKENPDIPVNADSLWEVLHKFIPDLTREDIENLHANGFRSLTNLSSAEEIDLALAGISADKAKMLHSNMKKF